MDFRQLVSDELKKVRTRGHYCKSWHEAYGLIAEEFDEFWDEVKKRPSNRNKENALKELVQIAALCQRAAEDLILDPLPSPPALDQRTRTFASV